MKDKFIHIKKNAIKNKHCNNIVKKLDNSKLEKSFNKNFYQAIFNIVPQDQEWFKDFFEVNPDFKINPIIEKSNSELTNREFYYKY